MGSFNHLTPDQKFLAESVFNYFKDKYGTLSVKIDCEIHPGLPWQPTFYFRKNKHEIIACEISEGKIYPQIFKLTNNDMTTVPVTIHCYAFCPQKVCIDPQNQKEFVELKKHGHGLLSVSEDGTVIERAKATPAVFYISDAYFKDDLIKGFSGTNKAAMVNAFDTYKNDPLSGIRDLCDYVEATIHKATDACNTKYSFGISTKETINKKLTLLTTKMGADPALLGMLPSIGAMMGYYSKVRNTVNHTPKNAKQAHKKYRQCRENFVNGIRALDEFINQFKNFGIKL